MARCAYSEHETSDTHVCERCGRVQPLEPSTDYFSFLGLERTLNIDEAALESQFYALSRRLHPDYFMAAEPAEQQASVDRSSMLNSAYRTLRDPWTRGKYLLTIEGYKEAEKRAPADLLEEVFDLNMQIEELKSARESGDESGVAEIRPSMLEAVAELRNRLDQMSVELARLSAELDRAMNEKDADRKKRVLDRLSQLMSHRSYVVNLIRDIEQEL
jgi:molecular chaperone HscB